jgi:diadenosine tetraphosphate (Ap4A) HIT family hydrolase
MPCPFCPPPSRRIVGQNEIALAILDQHPVSPGHTLIITRRHVASWFEASEAEQLAILALASERRQALDRELAPAGYNLGLNVGAAAGQTVMHLHVHLIPRFAGDVDDPTGGVRLVIPDRGNYRRPGFVPRSGGSGHG